MHIVPVRPRARLCAAVLALLGLLAAATAAQATFPGEPGRITFSSDRLGHFEIYSMNPDGSGRVRLTHTANGNSSIFSDWSPDGRWIAFDSDRAGGGNVDVFLMRSDGTGVRRLTASPGFDGDPVFSPDGRRIAFTHAATNGSSSNIFTMNIRGGDWRRVTTTALRDEFIPEYSPDGRWIAFTSTTPRGRIAGIEVVHPDGSARHLVTPFRLRAAEADWAPDGSRLVFEDNADVPHSSLWTIRPDGTGLRRLTSPPAQKNDFAPSFAPDGSRVVFVSDRGGGPEHPPDIWMVNADGSDPHRVTGRAAAVEIAADWGPRP